MRALLVWLLLLPAIAVQGVANGAGDDATLAISSDLRVRVLRGREIELEVRAADAGQLAQVVQRIAGTGRLDAVRAWNSASPQREEGWWSIPLTLLSDDYRRLVLLNLYPDDRAQGDDWIHVARSGPLPLYDEGLWQVALWFTDRGESFEALMKLNGLSSPELRAGQRIRVPRELLHGAFRAASRSTDGLLEYGTDGDGPYAAYTLQRGEALYSSVILRFTGRTVAEDVNHVAQQLKERNEIRDLRDMPVGFRVKIPLDLLEAEFLPSGHPRRLEADELREELARELKRQPAGGKTRNGLDGVVVVLDAGHGGRDLGTMNHEIWEHDYVYDVTCRLKQKLESETRAEVLLTLRDEETGCVPSTTDKLRANRQGTILTTPPFIAQKEGEAVIGVNLRWYLANSILREQKKKGTDPERIIFLSIHADSRHPSLRGVMVYVPGSAYRDKTYGHNSTTYRRYKEVREKPQIRFSKQDRLRSEAVSRKYADALVQVFQDESLPVQPFKPVRDRIIRGKSRYVPAVLGGNAIPAKVLVELVNLGNPEDAALLASAASRERLAQGLLDSLRRHFGETEGVQARN